MLTRSLHSRGIGCAAIVAGIALVILPEGTPAVAVVPAVVVHVALCGAYGFFKGRWTALGIATAVFLAVIAALILVASIRGTLPGEDADPGSHPGDNVLWLPFLWVIVSAGVSARRVINSRSRRDAPGGYRPSAGHPGRGDAGAP
jgi:hypothetical protein